MSQSASQARAFYQEVAKNMKLWTVKDSLGFPAPNNGGGKRVQPFWPSLSRAQRIIETAPAYSVFELYEIAWADFASNWVPYLIENGIFVGVNWSGTKAIGYDLEPAKIREIVESYAHKL